MSMDCKTCRGEGFVSFEAGAVVKRCPKCNGTGSSKFNAICEHIVSPLTKELAELRTANQRLEGEVKRLRDALTPEVIDWIRCGMATNGRLIDGDHPALEKLRAALSTNGEITE